MSETHVISALRAKRVEIAAHVHDTEKKLAKLRASLANLDAAMNLLTPGHPDAIPPRRGYRRTKYFARQELPRLIMDALRKATGPVTAGEIAAQAISANGLPASAKEPVTEMVLMTLKRLKKHGFKETEASLTMKLKRGAFAASFFLACLAALELPGVALEDV